MSLSALRSVGSIALSVVAFHRPKVSEYETHWKWLITSVLVVGAVTDVLLVIGLCYYLYQWRLGGLNKY